MKKHPSKKYHSVITKRIFQSVKKLSVVCLLLACASSLLTVPGTNAGFSDREDSQGNTWAAGSLDARATYVEHFQVEGMNPTQKPKHRITFTNEGSLDFRYGVRYQNTGGDALLCDALLLTAERNGVVVYDTLPMKDFDVKDFSSDPFTLAPFGDDNWDFTAELPADAGASLEHSSCQWAFDFTAWQTDLPDATHGFSDVEVVAPHSIATGEWLTPGDIIVNELMWMGSTVSTSDEWLELKNMTGSALSLSGWKLENAGTGGTTLTIPAGKSIPAHGYFLIANYDKTSASSALNVTGNWVTTSLALGNTNNGNVILKAPNNTVIDSALGETVWPAGSNGTLKQSMERNDVPGDGLLPENWHTCVSGAANGVPYWDATGNNFGTPQAANLSPIVMNEFVPNPVGDDGASRPDGEWIELYNILGTDIDVAGWYFTNHAGDHVAVTADQTESGETVVPGKGTLAVYLEQAFLDNDQDTLSLFAPGLLPQDESDDVREDTVSYHDASVLPEGKSFARFPDGEGIWLDPEATPGDENVMLTEEKQSFRYQAFETCFQDETLDRDATTDICSPFFLVYIGLLEQLDDTKMKSAALLTLLEEIRQEEANKLLALLGEDGVLTPEERALAEPVSEEPAPEEAPKRPSVSMTPPNEETTQEGPSVDTPTESESTEATVPTTDEAEPTEVSSENVSDAVTEGADSLSDTQTTPTEVISESPATHL